MVFVIAEVGINHNGDLMLAKKLIDAAMDAGADAVKFQKRNIDIAYDKATLESPRESPWGTSQREQKQGLEFGQEEFAAIDAYARGKGITWFASAWDRDSVEFLKQFNCPYNKIASPMLTHIPVLKAVAAQGKHTFISTGMSTLEEIAGAVAEFREADCPFELMHCDSRYPMPDGEANLMVMQTLHERFSCNVGYSGHETGIAVSVAAVAMGATSLERHITTDRAMYGSDQSASVETGGFSRLMEYVRLVEQAMGSGVDASSHHPNNPNQARLGAVSG
jgi:N-acetylneuraminate synthase